jgi:hypothetical protein
VNIKNEKNCEGFRKKLIFDLKNREKKQFFFDLLSFQAPGANNCAPNFKNSKNKKWFVIMKGNFFALAVKRIREKSKNDPPYSVVYLQNMG